MKSWAPPRKSLAAGARRNMRPTSFVKAWGALAVTVRVSDGSAAIISMVRRHLFEKLNGFDGRFFVYYEDLDFSLRAKQLGYESWFLAEASVFHGGCGTTDAIRAERLYYYLKSRIRYGFKHYGKASGILLLFATVFFEPFSRLIHDLFNCSSKNFTDTLNGFRMLIQDLIREEDPTAHDPERLKAL